MSTSLRQGGGGDANSVHHCSGGLWLHIADPQATGRVCGLLIFDLQTDQQPSSLQCRMLCKLTVACTTQAYSFFT